MPALLLLDAHIPTSIATPIARANEILLLQTIMARLGNVEARTPANDIAVLLLGDYWEWLDPAEWTVSEAYRVRTIHRADIADLWTDDEGLGSAGQRLVIDIGGAGRTIWRWLRLAA
ncbi:hypothetical protein [Sphingomonas antarctica]|uniref:hypothetical protein n=1 Tax=Sphingomonas antarctica TaxID=2040274 RepID=UPI0039E77E2B